MKATDQAGLSNSLREYALSLGVELYGVAKAESYAAEFPGKPQPDLFVRKARSVVVIGIPHEPTTVASALRAEELVPFYDPDSCVEDHKDAPAGLSHQGPVSTWFMSDEKLSIYRELNWIGYKMTKWLRLRGHTAFHFSVNKKDVRTLRAPFEHLPAMYLAGLGTMGLNCCILSRDFGPRVLVTSLVTDCRLKAGEPQKKDLCTKCGLCVKACPVNAIDGKGWKDPFACYNNRCCDLCIAVCPVGELKVPYWPEADHKRTATVPAVSQRRRPRTSQSP